MDADTRSQVRRRVSDACRRRAGAELGANGLTDMQQSAPKNHSLAVSAWEACEGDGLLALDYALDMLKAKREARTEAA